MDDIKNWTEERREEMSRKTIDKWGWDKVAEKWYSNF